VNDLPRDLARPRNPEGARLALAIGSGALLLLLNLGLLGWALTL
jgi:hypothetical protein